MVMCLGLTIGFNSEDPMSSGPSRVVHVGHQLDSKPTNHKGDYKAVTSLEK